MLLVAALAVGAVRRRAGPDGSAFTRQPGQPALPDGAVASQGAVPAKPHHPQGRRGGFRPRRRQQGRSKLDRQEAEHLPAVAQRFDQIDANHDSFISLAELTKAATALDDPSRGDHRPAFFAVHHNPHDRQQPGCGLWRLWMAETVRTRRKLCHRPGDNT